MKIIILYLILIMTLYSCQDEKQELYFYQTENNEEIKEPEENSILKKKVSVCIIPCSNGYEFELRYIEITTHLSILLSTEDSVELVYFPTKKFNGSGYQGVYDKKYAKSILENVNADFIIMSKYNSTLEKIESKKENWGYEIKILNTKTLQQKISIGNNKLKKNREIYDDINLKFDSFLLDLNSMIEE